RGVVWCRAWYTAAWRPPGGHHGHPANRTQLRQCRTRIGHLCALLLLDGPGQRRAPLRVGHDAGVHGSVAASQDLCEKVMAAVAAGNCKLAQDFGDLPNADASAKVIRYQTGRSSEGSCGQG